VPPHLLRMPLNFWFGPKQEERKDEFLKLFQI